jgi:SAM-dependent methyltransferase
VVDIHAVDPSFYDELYYTDGSKSNYAPYGPGTWADWIIEMVLEHLPRPHSVLDVGCAYGFLVERFLRVGVQSWGFDISQYAIEEQGYFGRTWVGDCTDPDAWVAVDLALACELGEHLTPDQAHQMLTNAHSFSSRLLMLVAVDLGEYDPHEENDGSHIHVVPMTWWEEAAREAGWTVSDASAFNEDRRSGEMGWSGRWLYLEKTEGG